MTDCSGNDDCSGNKYCDMSKNVCVAKENWAGVNFAMAFLLIAFIGNFLFLTKLKNTIYMWILLFVVMFTPVFIDGMFFMLNCTDNQDGTRDCGILPEGVLEGFLFGVAFIGVGVAIIKVGGLLPQKKPKQN